MNDIKKAMTKNRMRRINTVRLERLVTRVAHQLAIIDRRLSYMKHVATRTETRLVALAKAQGIDVKRR